VTVDVQRYPLHCHLVHVKLSAWPTPSHSNHRNMCTGVRVRLCPLADSLRRDRLQVQPLLFVRRFEEMLLTLCSSRSGLSFPDTWATAKSLPCDTPVMTFKPKPRPQARSAIAALRQATCFCARFEFGLVHTTVLSPYQPICGGSLPCAIYNPGLTVGPSGNSDQYNWLAADLASVRCHDNLQTQALPAATGWSRRCRAAGSP